MSAKRIGSFAAASAVALAALFWLAGREDAPSVSEPVAPARTAASAAIPSAAPAEEPVSAPPPPAPIAPAPEEPRREEGPARRTPQPVPEELFAEHADRLALERQADQRFDRALAETGITAREIDPEVRRLFEQMELEPVLVEGGFMDGFEIRRIDAESVLAQAGFRAGDRITSLDGEPLEDPAALPDLFIRLLRDFRVCGEREGARFCRDVDLDEVPET